MSHITNNHESYITPRNSRRQLYRPIQQYYQNSIAEKVNTKSIMYIYITMHTSCTQCISNRRVVPWENNGINRLWVIENTHRNVSTKMVHMRKEKTQTKFSFFLPPSADHEILGFERFLIVRYKRIMHFYDYRTVKKNQNEYNRTRVTRRSEYLYPQKSLIWREHMIN